MSWQEARQCMGCVKGLCQRRDAKTGATQATMGSHRGVQLPGPSDNVSEANLQNIHTHSMGIHPQGLQHSPPGPSDTVGSPERLKLGTSGETR